MKRAQIGPWQFEMPDGWCHTPNDFSDDYFESPDGTKGLYVKAIELSEPKISAHKLADYIQNVHFRGFNKATENSWDVVDKRVSHEAELVRSALDIYDATANYRVLSLVLCTAETGIQITIHDYWCEDYKASRGMFSSLETSIERVESAA